MTYDPCDPDSGEPDDTCDLGWLNDGRPTLMTLGNAVQCWALCQKKRPVTFGLAALAFDTPVERIAEAVENHPWLFACDGGPLADREIEHEGY